ncbi:CoA transferase [Kocuria rhizophila]|uniref:CaiB/BaiF CoA transferase family protein n=1 Tax=Kocuria rhizophila TaxID=72000 RepID=UPI001DA30DEA|nr:CoA transferase [Kocuria rhizophila]MCC5671967.1 CoA transferase [Kocuria rhizophila]MCC5673244.1 CoA transferase [Kocuria rhizophila]
MTEPLPLDGVLVADFSRVLAGPLCTMTLADLGARVIKVERPGAGDDTRQWGPPFSETGPTYYESVNRNKESVCLDLQTDEGRELARELAARADVVVENFKPGGMAKLGLGYDEIFAENPGVVYVSVSGFGTAGGAHMPGYDFLVQAVGGLMSITGPADGEPTKAGVALVDVLTAKDATIGALAALEQRRRTGRGAHIDVSLLSSLQGALVNQGQAYLGAGKVPQRMGNDHPSIVPYQLLQCADAPLAVTVGNDHQFRKFTEVLGIPETADDERYASNGARVDHREELTALLEEALAARTASEWQESLTEVGVPAGKVGGIDEGVALAEELGLEPTVDVQDRSGETVGRQFRHPAQWTPPLQSPTVAPPQLGEDTDAVTAWLRKPRG